MFYYRNFMCFCLLIIGIYNLLERIVKTISKIELISFRLEYFILFYLEESISLTMKEKATNHEIDDIK